MIIWLASYPRSGNTMFRMMLHRVFGCSTYSKYYVPKQSRDSKQAVAGKTGAAPLPGPWIECYGPMSQARDTTYLVKTHDGPEDKSKTIYIVRNGLAATRSYKHFLRDFNDADYSLEQVILGEPLFGSWGGHLDAWNPLERPDTLVLKYEDLVEQADEQLERVAGFTGLQMQGDWVNDFEQLRAKDSRMYRQGPGVAPEAGFTEEQQELFMALHGDWMGKLTYSEPRLTGRSFVRAALSERFHALGAVGREELRRVTMPAETGGAAELLGRI